MMNPNFNTFALSKSLLLVEKVVETNTASVREAIEDLDCADIRIPLLIQYTLMKYSKSLTTRAFVSLCHQTADTQKSLAADVDNYLKELYGDLGNYSTLFGDFPNTVLNMSEFEMAIQTLAHYWSNGAYFPKDYNILDGKNAEDTSVDWNLCVKDKYDMIDACDYKGLGEIFKRLVTANQSLSSYDREAIMFLARSYEQLSENDYDVDSPFLATVGALRTAENIPFKETLCLMIDAFEFEPKTVTDVLRYAVYLSGGDVMLPPIPKTISNGWEERKPTKEELKPFNFKRFTRAERRRILGMVERCLLHLNNSVAEDMKRHIARWLRLGECIHPMEYRNQFPLTATVFAKIRNDAKGIKGWASKVEEAKKGFMFDELMRLYSQKPGEFARSLDSLLRLFGEDDAVLDAFKSKIDHVSSKLLFEISEHFAARSVKNQRFVFPKGSRRAVKISTLPPLAQLTVDKILSMVLTEFVRRLLEKGTMEEKTVYLSNMTEKIMLPQNMRSVSVGKRVVGRGTHIPLPTDKDLLRFYCHWIDKYGTEDLDISAYFVGEQGKTISVSWKKKYGIKDNVAIFSGDVRKRQGNCAEYIDVSVSNTLRNGWKYVVVCVSDYNGHDFKAPSFSGFMARDKWGTKGEKTWRPETVENEFVITSQCENVVMGIVDLENREWIIVDEDLAGIPVVNPTSSHKTPKLDKLIARYTAPRFWNAYRVIFMNLFARKANYKVIDESQVNGLKAEIELNKKTLSEQMQKEYDSIKADGLSESDAEIANAQIRQRYDEEFRKLENTEVISFEDLLKDYSLLFPYLE